MSNHSNSGNTNLIVSFVVLIKVIISLGAIVIADSFEKLISFG